MDKKTTRRLRNVIIHALKAAYDVNISLGENGKKLVEIDGEPSVNQYGDKPVQLDVSAEKSVLTSLRKHDVSIRVISEEHGTTDLTNTPEYLGILDGLDGSSVYKEGATDVKYGTMFAIFEGLEPTYNDYIACGVVDQTTGNMYIASKKGGAIMYDGTKFSSIYTSLYSDITPEIEIFIDEYFEINRTTFSDKLQQFSPKYLKASAHYYTAVASDKGAFALECTRKGNLEIAVAYGLIKEAGGVMVDLQGNDIGDKPYLTFGQDEHIPIITAANRDLVEKLLKIIS